MLGHQALDFGRSEIFASQDVLAGSSCQCCDMGVRDISDVAERMPAGADDRRIFLQAEPMDQERCRHPAGRGRARPQHEAGIEDDHVATAILGGARQPFAFYFRAVVGVEVFCDSLAAARLSKDDGLCAASNRRHGRREYDTGGRIGRVERFEKGLDDGDVLLGVRIQGKPRLPVATGRKDRGVNADQRQFKPRDIGQIAIDRAHTFGKLCSCATDVGDYLVAGVSGSAHDVLAEIAGSSGDQDFHWCAPILAAEFKAKYPKCGKGNDARGGRRAFPRVVRALNSSRSYNSTLLHGINIGMDCLTGTYR